MNSNILSAWCIPQCDWIRIWLLYDTWTTKSSHHRTTNTGSKRLLQQEQNCVFEADMTTPEMLSQLLYHKCNKPPVHINVKKTHLLIERHKMSKMLPQHPLLILIVLAEMCCTQIHFLPHLLGFLWKCSQMYRFFPVPPLLIDKGQQMLFSKL